MQTARQEARRLREAQRAEERSVRARTIAAIHTVWKKIRRDLRDPEELREQRLAFMASVVHKKEISSTNDLTNRQLGLVLDAMREFERQPELPGTQSLHLQPAQTQSEIHHLATAAQVATLDKLFAFLDWSDYGRETFIEKRFRRRSHRLLTPKQANSLTMILMTIAAGRSIKERTKMTSVSRRMIAVEIPALKRRLGIDVSPADEE